MLLLESVQLSNLTLEILDGCKLQKFNLVLRKPNTSESKPGLIANPQEQMLSISMLIWLKPRVTKLFPSLKTKIFSLAYSNLYFISTSLVEILASIRY